MEYVRVTVATLLPGTVAAIIPWIKSIDWMAINGFMQFLVNGMALATGILGFAYVLIKVGKLLRKKTMYNLPKYNEETTTT